MNRNLWIIAMAGPWLFVNALFAQAPAGAPPASGFFSALSDIFCSVRRVSRSNKAQIQAALGARHWTVSSNPVLALNWKGSSWQERVAPPVPIEKHKNQEAANSRQKPMSAL